LRFSAGAIILVALQQSTTFTECLHKKALGGVFEGMKEEIEKD
jgi:hypothetical protein